MIRATLILTLAATLASCGPHHHATATDPAGRDPATLRDVAGTPGKGTGPGIDNGDGTISVAPK